LPTIGCVELVYLADIGACRHQDKPRVMAIVHQQQVTQRQAPENDAVFCQLRM
jgi:hypothetical protein